MLSLLFMLLYDLVDYFDFETKIEGFPIYSSFSGSIITYLASSKAPLIEALQSKTSSKIKSVKKKKRYIKWEMLTDALRALI